jgi:hypothetical protein
MKKHSCPICNITFEDDFCPGCDVDFSDPCHVCGEAGYHADTCPESDENHRE